MKEVIPNLFVGSDDDLAAFAMEAEKRCAEKTIAIVSSSMEPAGFYVHAAKEPWHRQALGYTTRGAPQGSLEYLFARRHARLALNLVDVEEKRAQYIPDELLDEALKTIRWALKVAHKPVFVHCNKGESRGPSIALMYLISHTDFAEGLTFELAEEKFKLTYPNYNPSGIRLKTKERFERRYKND